MTLAGDVCTWPFASVDAVQRYVRCLGWTGKSSADGEDDADDPKADAL
jgi:hypothetical protein